LPKVLPQYLFPNSGNFDAVARRKGDKWYLGAMTDWTPRELELNLSFLKEGTYSMEVFKDGINADRFAEDYTLKRLEVNKNSKISAGGGWTAIISKQGID
jgi:alpha-glucosidase